MSVTKVGTWFDEGIGRGGDFDLLRVGGKLYYGLVANRVGNDPEGGSLRVGAVGGAIAERKFHFAAIDLPGGALDVRLDLGDDGYLHAHVSAIFDAGGDNNRRTITDLKTDIRVAASVEPAPTPPAPGDPTLVFARAVDALRADVAKLSLAVGSAHDGTDAVYRSLGVKSGEKTVGGLLTELRQAVEAGDAAATTVAELLFRPPTRDYGLPHELEPFVATDFQQYLCATLIALGEYISRLPEFPKADGTSILRS